MKILFFMNFLIAFTIFILFSINFFKHHSHGKIGKIINRLALIGLFYFGISVFFFLWTFDYFEYRYLDFEFIYSFVVLIQTLLIYSIFYLFSKSKNIFLFLGIYLIPILGIFLEWNSLEYWFLIFSFLEELFVFLIVIFKSKSYQEIGVFGIIYVFIALFFQTLLIFEKGNLLIFNLFITTLLLILGIYFLKKIKKYPPLVISDTMYKAESYFLMFLKSFVFILVITNFVFLGTIVIHELGHLSVAHFYNCQHSRIIYEKNLPHTEILCSNMKNNVFLILGGVLLPIILGIILFILGGKLTKSISLLILGFNLIISQKDFLDLGFSSNIALSGIILGVLFLIIGIIKLTKSQTEIRFL